MSEIPKYDFLAIEKKWQETWHKAHLFEAVPPTAKGEKKYILEMFAYPSGDLHMGHARNYTIGDVAARFAHMQGASVLHPVGFDAFGLPAENAAIKHHTHPATWTEGNIQQALSTMRKMGFSYDFSHVVKTCDPAYYKWGQYLFLRMWQKGLVERKKSPVNWCETCNTVLANEQVTEGTCWRCGNPVQKKELTQWYLKITEYAQELLDDLDTLDGWPERVKQMQRNWIGRSKGAYVDFALVEDENNTHPTTITVFTTRPDTLFGASFFLLAPDHELLKEIVVDAKAQKDVQEVAAYAEKISAVERTNSAYEKHGAFTGRYVINPVNGDKIPIWAADYVLNDYGTGAVMAVPSGDQRDFEFAKKYDLDIIPVVLPKIDPLYDELKDSKEVRVRNVDWSEAQAGEGILVQSGDFSGMTGGHGSKASQKIVDWLESIGKGRHATMFRLRDWLISRQRYWGNPIPAIHCDTCGIVPVPVSDLPVELPKDINLSAGETLAEYPAFYETVCPECGQPAKRETDTMDTFTDSSWYFLRYCDPINPNEPVSHAAAKQWMPIDNYIGGIEHAILHLLYSRFWVKVMRDLGMVDVDEPFSHLLCQGMVKDAHGQTMSKSLGNVVSPLSVIDPYGADTLRVAILFIAPPEKDVAWDENAVQGCHRFLKRMWRLIWLFNARGKKGELNTDIISKESLAFWKTLNRLGIKCTRDYERMQYNTAIASLMELVNAAYNFLDTSEQSETAPQLFYEAARIMVLLLAPVAPHMADELGREVYGFEKSCYNMSWPTFDDSLAKEDEIEYVLQVNGKLRARILLSPDLEKDAIEQAAKEALAAHIDDKTVRKIIIVPQKLVNIVVG